jgi:hypothetical protein
MNGIDQKRISTRHGGAVQSLMDAALLAILLLLALSVRIDLDASQAVPVGGLHAAEPAAATVVPEILPSSGSTGACAAMKALISS